MKKVKFFSFVLALALAAATTVAFKAEDGTRPAFITGDCDVENVPDTCQPNNAGPQCVGTSYAWLNAGCETPLNMPKP